MLVLSRKIDEEIIIGNDIVVRVIEVTGTVAKLGVSAPADVQIDRAEVRQRRIADGNVDRRERVGS